MERQRLISGSLITNRPKAKYAKAKVIYSFGQVDKVDRAVLERLAKSISWFLSPEQAWEAREAIREASPFLS